MARDENSTDCTPPSPNMGGVAEDKKRPRIQMDFVFPLLCVGALTSLIVLVVHFQSRGIYDHVRVNKGINGKFDSSDLQRKIDEFRVAENERVGVYEPPSCNEKARFRASYGMTCVDGLEHKAWFMVMMMSRDNFAKAMGMLASLICCVVSIGLTLIVGRQRVLNEAIEIRRQMNRLRSVNGLVQGNSSASFNGVNLEAEDRSGSDQWSTQRSFRTSALYALEKQLANVPYLDLRLLGTNLYSLIVTVWFVAACGLTIGYVFILEPAPPTHSHLANHGVQQTKEYWSQERSDLMIHIALGVLMGGWPILFILLDILCFTLCVIPYNLYRMAAKRKAAASPKKATYFTGPAADRPPRSPPRSPTKAPRHGFSNVEDLSWADRIDVFFTEWRILNRALLPPRIWRFVTGHSRGFFDLSCCNCNQIENTTFGNKPNGGNTPQLMVPAGSVSSIPNTPYLVGLQVPGGNATGLQSQASFEITRQATNDIPTIKKTANPQNSQLGSPLTSTHPGDDDVTPSSLREAEV